MSSRAQAELAGANLRQRGAQPLPDRGRAGEHRHPPGIRHPHQTGLERTAPGALDAMGEPDADVAALAPRGDLTARKILPAGRLQDFRLAGRIVAAVVLHARTGARPERLGIGHLRRRNEIAAAHFGALQAQFARHPVHQAFHGEGRLRIAGAAHRRHRRLVGGGDRDVDRQRGKHVGPAHHRGGVVGNVDVLQRIGPEIMDQPAADAEQPGIGGNRDVDRPILVALLGRVGEMFAPVLDPFDRAPQELGGRHHRDVFGVDAELGTETAADVGGGHAQPALVEIEKRGQGLEQVVRLLRRRPDRHGVIAPFRENAAALDRMGGAAMLPQLLVEHVRGLVEGRVGIAVGHPVGGGDVGVELAPHRRRSRLGRPAAVRHGGKHVVVDRDQRRRVLGKIAVVGQDQRDRLADVRHLPVGEGEGPVAVERRPGIGVAQHPTLGEDRREIVEREHRAHPRQRQRGMGVDPADRGVRVGAAHERRLPGAGVRDVVDETSLAGEQGLILEARNARSDQSTHRRRVSPTWPWRPWR